MSDEELIEDLTEKIKEIKKEEQEKEIMKIYREMRKKFKLSPPPKVSVNEKKEKKTDQEMIQEALEIIENL